MNSPDLPLQFPVPWGTEDYQAYEAQAYHFPLTDVVVNGLVAADPQDVFRIPVAGPPPFNTLAVVRTVFFVTSLHMEDERVYPFRVAMPTNLVLAGYDRRRPEQQKVQHSSSATLRMMQINAQGTFEDSNITFTFAAEQVEDDSRLDETGRWHVIVRGNSSIIATDLRTACAATVEISSWVLCWEPARLT